MPDVASDCLNRTKRQRLKIKQNIVTLTRAFNPPAQFAFAIFKCELLNVSMEGSNRLLEHLFEKVIQKLKN